MPIQRRWHCPGIGIHQRLAHGDRGLDRRQIEGATAEAGVIIENRAATKKETYLIAGRGDIELESFISLGNEIATDWDINRGRRRADRNRPGAGGCYVLGARPASA